MTDIVEILRAMNEDGVNHVGHAGDVIESLRQELAACQRSLNAAKQVIASKEARQLAESVVDEARATLDSEREANARLTEELAACQAHNRVLRGALEWVQARSAENHIVNDALSQPADDSALRAALAAERERCARVFEDDEGIHKTTAEAWANPPVAIRALGD